MDRQKQLRRRFVKPAFEEMGCTDRHRAYPYARAGSGAARSRACSMARSGWLAQSRRTPLTNQPRAKLGLSASARSTSPIMAADILAEIGQHKGGKARTPGSSPCFHRERLPSEIDSPCGGLSRLFGPAVIRAAGGKSPPKRVPARNADRARSPDRANLSRENPVFRRRANEISSARR